MYTSRITTLPDQPEHPRKGQVAGGIQGGEKGYQVCQILYIDNLSEMSFFSFRELARIFLHECINLHIISAKVVEEAREKNATYWHKDGDVWTKEILNESLCGEQYYLPNHQKRKRRRTQDPDYEIYHYDKQLTSLVTKLAMLAIFIIGVKILQLTFS